MEWILAEKKTSIPVEVWQMDNTYKKDSISECEEGEYPELLPWFRP